MMSRPPCSIVGPNHLLLLVAMFLGLPSNACADGVAIVNGNFDDLQGLTPHGGNGWHDGVPAGWRATAPLPLYAVHVVPQDGPTACNVSQLGILEQTVGTLAEAADLVLSMDVTDAWHKGAELAAEICDTDGEIYGRVQLDAGHDQPLIVSRVPAGTEVVVRFQAIHGTTPALDNVRLTIHEAGSRMPTPRLRVRMFQPDQPLARSRRAATVTAEIDHLNSDDVDVRVSLAPPPGVRVVHAPEGEVHRLRATDARSSLTWRIEAVAATTADIGLEVRSMDGSLVARERLRMLFLPPVEERSAGSIPEPEPARADRLIGAHHCPLWEPDRPDMWLNLLRHPDRMPALGLYAQNNAEVADWETKWAVEHGISFFIYCWYRDGEGGAVKTRFGSAIHDGLFKSRFVNRMQFALMWENQSRGIGGVADEEDLFTNLMPYWLDNYFRHESYLRVDNKPVLFIYRPELLVEDLGGVANVAAALDTLRRKCRDAGFDGLWILGEYRGTDPTRLALLKSLGLDCTFAYCWPIAGSPTPEQAVHAQMDAIRKTHEFAVLPQVVTVSQGWSGWQDEGSIWRIPPPQYEQLLRQAKDFTDALPKGDLGSRMLLLDNWNEWGEGHFIAPYREHGFGYLDAVRRVFCPMATEHVDLLPEDVGLGPYDQSARAHFAALDEKWRLGATLVKNPVVPRGLVAWWTFDEPDDGPVAFDVSGHRRGGFLEKATRVPGFSGRGLRCDGGCVLVPGGGAVGGLQKLTLTCRVRTDVAGQDNRWIVNGVFGHNVRGGFRLGLMGGRPCFQVPLTDWSHHLVGAKPLPLGRWVHLAASFDGNSMSLFMDGEACGSMQRPGALAATDGRLVLGSYDVDHPAFFTGLLDDVRLYRRIVPDEEIRSEAVARAE